MSTPIVAGIFSLMRSVDPLKTRTALRTIMAATANRITCINDAECGLGVPDAAAAVNAALGGTNVANRTTPLFSFYSSAATNHFFTTVPQMAMAAAAGGLVPKPSASTLPYQGYGSTIASYPTYPKANVCAYTPCTPKTIATVFTTHVHPLGSADLVPLYRMSYKCGDELLTTPPGSNPACLTNPNHVSHFYSTDAQAVSIYTGFSIDGVKELSYPGLGYKLDGIEGFIYSPLVAQPSGTRKLCRKYDASRDDYMLTLGAGASGTDCSATTDGYNGGNYNQAAGGTDFIGWALPTSAALGPTPTNTSPTVSVTMPTNGANYVVSVPITVRASAADSDGSISRVRFFANQKFIGERTSSPYQISWAPSAGGTYAMLAVALDDRGAVTESTNTVSINVTASQPPAVTNNSFENPQLPSATYASGSQGGWSMQAADPWGQSAITANGSVFTGPNLIAPNLLQAAFIQGEKYIKRQVNFPAGSFKIKFRCAQRYYNTHTLKIRIFVGGVQVGTAEPTTAVTPYDTCYSNPFLISTAGNLWLEFRGWNECMDDESAFIDNVKVLLPNEQ